MLKKIQNIKKEDLILILSWLKGESVLLNKKFNHEKLIKLCEQSSDDDINISNDIDELLYDSFELYERLKKTNINDILKRASDMHDDDVMEMKSMLNINTDVMINESINNMLSFITLYEEMMTTVKFDYPHVRGIQKGILTLLLQDSIKSEDYEKCFELKNKIDEV